jgi:hypothetical protein
VQARLHRQGKETQVEPVLLLVLRPVITTPVVAAVQARQVLTRYKVLTAAQVALD